MRKDLHCPYSVLNQDLICEHKSARVDVPGTVTLHNHNGYEILLFLAGDVNIIVEEAEKKMERGDLIIVPPYTFHGLNLTDVAHYERVVLNIRPQLLTKLSDENTDLAQLFQVFSDKTLHLLHLEESEIVYYLDLLERLEADYKASEPTTTPLLSKALLTQFLLYLTGTSSSKKVHEYENIMSPLITKIFEYVDEHITEDLTVEGIASHFHHNSDYLGRIFKEATGGHLKYYINAKKISLAQQYLTQGYSPYDVCYMTGYNNYSSFSRRFVAHIGMSPKQYQKNPTEN